MVFVTQTLCGRAQCIDHAHQEAPPDGDYRFTTRQEICRMMAFWCALKSLNRGNANHINAFVESHLFDMLGKLLVYLTFLSINGRVRF
jgi:hypothetical protein